MRTSLLVGIALFSLVASGCGSSPTPASPSPGGGGGGSALAPVQIYILGTDFQPNPATVPRGSAVAFVNSDTERHHIVATDGSFDAGVLDPDQSSDPIALTTDGAHFYCTIHPSEVGSINASNGTPPPCSGPHC